LHVSDVAAAAEMLAGYSPPIGGPRIFNIGGGHGLSLLQVVDGLSAALNRKPHILFAPSRLLDVPKNVLDISLAKEHLHWSPRVSFEDGLRRTLKVHP
jgi:UDP-glucose 4-epimerase